MSTDEALSAMGKKKWSVPKDQRWTTKRMERNKRYIFCIREFPWEMLHFEDNIQKGENEAGLFLVPSKIGWITTGKIHNMEMDHDSLTMLTYSAGPLTMQFYGGNMDCMLSEKPIMEDL